MNDINDLKNAINTIQQYCENRESKDKCIFYSGNNPNKNLFSCEKCLLQRLYPCNWDRIEVK